MYLCRSQTHMCEVSYPLLSTSPAYPDTRSYALCWATHALPPPNTGVLSLAGQPKATSSVARTSSHDHGQSTTRNTGSSNNSLCARLITSTKARNSPCETIASLAALSSPCAEPVTRIQIQPTHTFSWIAYYKRKYVPRTFYL